MTAIPMTSGRSSRRATTSTACCVALLGSAQHSIVVNMYGYDDEELNKIIQSKLTDERIYVQMSLDRSQAAGSTSGQILARWANDSFGNSIAVGTSSLRNAISHLKIVIVDGVYTVKGSTNWSLSGEQQQDNELTLSRNAVIAAEARAILDLNHDFMLKQMVGTHLDVAHLLAPAGTDAAPPLPPPPIRSLPGPGLIQGITNDMVGPTMLLSDMRAPTMSFAPSGGAARGAGQSWREGHDRLSLGIGSVAGHERRRAGVIPHRA